MNIDGIQRDFVIHEFDALRNELDGRMAERRDNIRNTLIAVGAIWTWLATHDVNPYYEIAKWLPFVISAFFAVRSLAIREGSKRIAEYTANVEDALQLPGELGWERFNKGRKRLCGTLGKRWENGFWIVMSVGNLVAAICVDVTTKNPHP